MDTNNRTMQIVIGVALAVVLVAGIFWAMNRDKKDGSANKTDSASQMQQTTKANKVEEQKPGDIVAVASGAQNLSTLVSAVKAAGLVETLQGTGPFTVFAPTNAAFEALPAGTLDTLLKPENVEQLKSILTYHVVSGKVMAADLKDGQEVMTVQGGKLTVSIADGKVYLTDAKGSKVMVEKADVPASNGVVHIISGVLLPS